MRAALRERVVASGAALVSAGATSLTGLLVNVAAATTLDSVAFGRFSFVYVVVLGIITLLRAVCGEVVLFTDSSPALAAARRSSTVAVLMMAAAGAAVVAILGPTLDHAGYAAAAALVPVCVQDNYRYLSFVARRTEVAAVSDLITAAGPLAIVLFARNGDTAGVYALIAWGAAALVGSVVAERMLRPGHGVHPGPMFAAELRPLRRAALTEFVSTAMLYQVPLVMLPLVAGYADVGSMRGLQMAFSPVTILHAALFALVVPRLTRGFEQSGQVRYDLIMMYIAALTGLTLAIALAVSETPASIAERALGEISGSVQHHAWVYLVVQVLAIGAAAVTVAYRIGQRYHSIVRVRLASSIAAPVLCLTGALGFGVTGACLGLAVSQVLYLALVRVPVSSAAWKVAS